jgi:hypothetical protein
MHGQVAMAQPPFFCKVVACSLQDRVDDDTVEGHRAQSRLRSSACGEVSDLFGMLPMAASLQLPGAALASGLWHRLVLSQIPPDTPVVCCDCRAADATPAQPPHGLQGPHKGCDHPP